MTEEEWLACIDDIHAMSSVALRHRFSRTRRFLNWVGFNWADLGLDRKFRLMACSLCRRHFDQLGNDDQRRTVEVAEASIDKQRRTEAEEKSIRGTAVLAQNLFQSGVEAYAKAATYLDPEVASERKASLDSTTLSACDLFRELFGNPFRPVAFDPTWRTTSVVSIAWSMYDSRDFSPMPLLTDALQDAGCEHTDILDHCRSTSPHVRGCWVVDLVLGKE